MRAIEAIACTGVEPQHGLGDFLGRVLPIPIAPLVVIALQAADLALCGVEFGLQPHVFLAQPRPTAAVARAFAFIRPARRCLKSSPYNGRVVELQTLGKPDILPPLLDCRQVVQT